MMGKWCIVWVVAVSNIVRNVLSLQVVEVINLIVIEQRRDMRMNALLTAVIVLGAALMVAACAGRYKAKGGQGPGLSVFPWMSSRKP